jgi:hypothetical protein
MAGLTAGIDYVEGYQQQNGLTALVYSANVPILQSQEDPWTWLAARRLHSCTAM